MICLIEAWKEGRVAPSGRHRAESPLTAPSRRSAGCRRRLLHLHGAKSAVLAGCRSALPRPPVRISSVFVPQILRDAPLGSRAKRRTAASSARKSARSRSGPNPLKSATGGRPARGRPAAPPQKGPRSSGRAKPLKPVPGGPPQKGPRSGGGPKAAKVASSGRSAKRSWLHSRLLAQTFCFN